jgi:hypothetical protein
VLLPVTDSQSTLAEARPAFQAATQRSSCVTFPISRASAIQYSYAAQHISSIVSIAVSGISRATLVCQTTATVPSVANQDTSDERNVATGSPWAFLNDQGRDRVGAGLARKQARGNRGAGRDLGTLVCAQHDDNQGPTSRQG